MSLMHSSFGVASFARYLHLVYPWMNQPQTHHMIRLTQVSFISFPSAYECRINLKH
jgi:hypothetical protein